MLATIKTGEAAARRDLRLQLVTEQLTGQPQDDTFTSPAMARGVEFEAAARSAYENLTGDLVQEVGFISHDTLMAGVSPDGHVNNLQRLVEIKVPKSSTHLATIRAGRVPSAYIPQLIHQLWITGAESVDFFSWDDRFPAHLQSFLVTVKRAEVDIAAYEVAARLFLSECDKELESLRGLCHAV